MLGALKKALVPAVVLLLALPVGVLADGLQTDSDTLTVAPGQTGALSVTLAPGANQTAHVGAVINRNGSKHVAFGVPITASVDTGPSGGQGALFLGAPNPGSGYVTDYDEAGEFKTDVLITAPTTGLTCDVPKNRLTASFTGKIVFAVPEGTQGLGGNLTVALTINLTVDGGSCTTPNVAPAIAWTANPASADEGQTKTYSFSITDSDSSSWDFASGYPDCGSGGSLVSDSASIDDVAMTGTFQCSFPDGPATPTVSVQVTDGTDVSNELSQAVEVANVAPTLDALTPTGASAVACIGGNSVGLDLSWTDPAGTLDADFAYDVNWGDGTPHATGTSSSLSVSGLSHVYAAGTYTISATVTDKDGGVSAAKTASVSLLYNVTGVLQPVNDTQAHQDPSIFKYGSTIPVKIQVTDCHGTPVSGLAPKISVQKISGSTPVSGTDETIVSTSAADTGTVMRFSDNLYIYNLATKSLSDSSATYQITITGPFSPVTAMFGTKPK